MDLKDLLRSMRRHWVVAAVAFVFVFVLGVAAAYLPKERFKASAVVLVQPDPDKTQIAAVQVVGFLMPSLVAQIYSGDFYTHAVDRLPPDLARARASIDAADTKGTGLLTVTAVSANRRAVAPWANAFAQELVANPPSSGYVTIDVLDRARTPRSPFSPVRQPILLAGTALGVIAAVFATLAANALRRRVAGAEEVRQRFGTSVLGEIPLAKRRGFGRTPAQLFSGDDMPEVVEAFQSLRTSIEILLHTTRPQAIAITSSSTGEGKSSVASHLAWALASVGHKVTLVDADLRRPTQHHIFDQPLGPGVASAGTADPASLVRRTDVPSLGLVPAGAPDRHPAEVMTFNLPSLLEALSRPDGVVLIDCPPLTGVAETGIIASMTGWVVLVIDARRRDLLDIERSLTELRDKQATVLGVVINRSRSWRTRGADRYYHIPSKTAPKPVGPATASAPGTDGRPTPQPATPGRQEGRTTADG